MITDMPLVGVANRGPVRYLFCACVYSMIYCNLKIPSRKRTGIITMYLKQVSAVWSYFSTEI